MPESAPEPDPTTPDASAEGSAAPVDASASPEGDEAPAAFELPVEPDADADAAPGDSSPAMPPKARQQMPPPRPVTLRR